MKRTATIFWCCAVACSDRDVGPRIAENIFGELGDPLPNISAGERALFARGRELLDRRWTPSEGLGPRYDAVFCAACHRRPTNGGSNHRYRDSFVATSTQPTFLLEVVQQFSTADPQRAPTRSGATTAVRNPIPFFGIGLLAEIPLDEIISREDPNDADGDGISGRVNFERGFVGRFGTKAQLASLSGFIRLALRDHLGLSSDPVDVGGLPGGADIPVELRIRDDDAIADPELSGDDLLAIIGFAALLAAPAPAAPNDETELGRELFAELRCDACHAPALEGPRGGIPAYTDLLLHDLGAELADGVEVGGAEAFEFRTQPLWGASSPYLHDGRADTIDDAIRFHAGEAEQSRSDYEALGDGDQDAVIAFVASLAGEHDDDPAPSAGVVGGPRSELSSEALAAFARGRERFDHAVTLEEGLGPDYNGDACGSCHFEPEVGGAGPSDVDVLRYDANGEDRIAHRFAIDGRRPEPGAESFERRQTPPLFGLGAIEAIPDAAILAGADPDDRDGDGIRGRARSTTEGRVGRFGWKAGAATIEDFTRDALRNELGLADAEVSDDVEVIAAFVRELAPPPPTELSNDLFAAIGCAACHVPSLPDGAGTPVPLYSDLLLHEIWPADVALVPDAVAGRAFRTAPLWGVGRSAPYLHDGSAETLEQAIRRHDGEAAASRDRFASASDAERAQLIEFLRSL